MTNVVLVDSNYLFQEAFAKIVAKNAECILAGIASSQEEAVQTIQTCQPQIIFVDVMVGGEDSFLLCQQLKKQYPTTHIYVLSGYCSLNYMREAMNAGVDEYLLKPVSSKKLEKILEENKKESVSKEEYEEKLLQTVEEKDYKETYVAVKDYIKNIFEKYLIADREEKIRNMAGMLFSTITCMADSQKQHYLDKYKLSKKICQNAILATHWMMQIVTEVFKQRCVLKYSHMGRVFQYIENHINEEISLSDLSNKAEISSGYLSRIFKKYYKISIVDYIHMRKIQQAKYYMASSDMNISDISYLLGYSEAGYFCKIFKKYDMVTPSAFYNHYIKNKVS